jgi:hypothetical protein
MPHELRICNPKQASELDFPFYHRQCFYSASATAHNPILAAAAFAFRRLANTTSYNKAGQGNEFEPRRAGTPLYFRRVILAPLLLEKVILSYVDVVLLRHP